MEVDMAGQFSYSFGYWWFKGNYAATASLEGNTVSKTRYLASSMRIERYYSSIREETTPLNADATTLLNNNDYVGFFKACGPNYIRGVRRAQEVAAFLKFKSSSTERAYEYARSAQVSHWWYNRRWEGGRQVSSTLNAESSSLEIVIQAYGIGLRQDGSETFIAMSIDEYNNVMKFAFRQMTVLEGDNIHVGMVYGMEVVPWVHNTAFQIQTNLLEEAVEIPLLRSLIPRAYLRTNQALVWNAADSPDRLDYRCKEITYSIDQHGFCCELGALYDFVSAEYDSSDPENRTCRPMRQLDPVFIKDNLAANGEFVARMDRSVRYKLNQMGTLERCISAVRSIPDTYNYHLLKSDNTKLDGNINIDLSVFELKMALDPFGDYGMLKHMAKELDEFIDMFIQPCYAALFGTNIGISPETDVSWFMAYPWHNHDECTKLSCFGNSMRWDRSNPDGGCIPSLISGSDSPKYRVGSDVACKQKYHNHDLKCKDSTAELDSVHAKTTACWAAAVPRGSVAYFMEQFCMPSLNGQQLPPHAQQALAENHLRACSAGDADSGGGLVSYLNVAYNQETSQISNYSRMGPASRAVDGNTDGAYPRGEATHTHYNTDPWWQVVLAQEYEISSVKVWNRSDGSKSRINGFIVVALVDGTVTYESPAHVYVEGEDQMIEKFMPVGTMADTIRIEINGRDEFLQLAEVEVFTRILVENQFAAGSTIEAGDSIYSDDYKFKLAYQNDGNLVLYDSTTGVPLWASHTSGTTQGAVMLTSNGELKVTDSSGANKFISDVNAAHSGAYLQVLNDNGTGNVVIKSSDGQTTLWSTSYSGKYTIKTKWNTQIRIYSNDERTDVTSNGEHMRLNDEGNNQYSIRADALGDKYLSVQGSGPSVRVINVSTSSPSETELFEIIVLGNGTIAFKSVKYGNYLRAWSNGKLDTQYYIGSWERFTLENVY